MSYQKVENITLIILAIALILIGIGAYTENVELIMITSFGAGGLALLVWLPAVIIAEIKDSFDKDKQ